MIDSIESPNDHPSTQIERSSVAIQLQEAIELHKAGNLMEAGLRYKTILESHPSHPEANHYLGVIAVQADQPGAGLPYLMAALDADPTRSEFWRDYIDALLLDEQFDDASRILELARQHGLEGPEIDALARRIDASKTIVAPSDGITPRPQDMDKVLSLFRQGRHAEAAVIARKITKCFPRHAFGWKTLGVALKQLGKNNAALEPMEKAVALSPDDVESIYNLGVTLQGLERPDEAAEQYRQALQLDADYADAALNLGVILFQQGHLDDAAASLQQALRNKPGSAAGHSHLGMTYQKLGRLEEAEESYRQVLQINPMDANAHNDLAIVLQQQGRLDEADGHFQIVLLNSPDNVLLLRNRGNLLRHMGRLGEAESCYRMALKRDPENVESLVALGDVLRLIRQHADAVSCYRKAMQLAPEYSIILLPLGCALQDQGHLDQAIDCFKQYLSINPENAAAWSNLGSAYLSLGNQTEADTCFRKAVAIAPRHAPFHSNLLYHLMLSMPADANSVFLEHKRFGEYFESNFKDLSTKHETNCDPERDLRIGFISPDFNNHAVTSFIEPVLSHLSRNPNVSVHAYYNSHINDDATDLLRSYFTNWNPVANLEDTDLAAKIRKDGIDILIDLAGHTAGNRLTVFAYKPAPIQASWIGYPGTTGLSSVDYYFADRFLLPPGKFDDQFVEKVVRLPANAPFQPDKAAPPVNPLPALSNGHITFGSFNRPNKISREVIALWARLLRSLPDSRMVLGGLPIGDSLAALTAWFTEERIDGSRIDLFPRSGMPEYLALHHKVDICLDTFPYNGGTTTNHALWMGVPTLTLAGANMAGRVGAANLSHVGLEEFIAETPDEFLERGTYWTTNLNRLSKLRMGMRERIQHSSLRNPDLLAKSVTQALRAVWRRHCAGLPAESFEVELPVHNISNGESTS